MRPIFKTALAAALLVAAHGAYGQTLAVLFPPLATEVSARLGALTGKLTGVQKKQKSALAKAAKALAVETDDVGKTIADALAAASAIEPRFRDDPTLPGLFDQVVGTVQGIVLERRTTLDASIAAVPAGKTKTALQKAAAAADAADLRFTAATTRVAQLKAMKQKYAAIVKGEKQAAKAGAGIVATKFVDVDVETLHLRFPGLPPTIYAIDVFSLGQGSFTMRVAGGIGQARHNFTLVVAAPGPGVHDLTVGPTSSYFTAGVGPLPAVSGSVDFSTWDPTNGKAAGIFTATFSDGTTTVHLTKGSFASMAVQSH